MKLPSIRDNFRTVTLWLAALTVCGVLLGARLWRNVTTFVPTPQSGAEVPLPGRAPLPGLQAALESAAYFVDEAQSAGIDFVYDNGDDPSVAGMKLFQNFGGAVAAFDYDEDGWPDLYFTQGADIEAAVPQAAASNRLYRNLGNGRFADVSSATLTGDRGYGQGVAVGDFDNDGFGDLYVANIGRNVLYQNNGDGTFREVTDAAGLVDAKWTAGCMLVDLNGDAFPDIYDVNYLEGDAPFTQVCPVAGQPQPRSCKPDMFPAAQDRLYVSLGDGTFADVTGASGISAPDGKGLGAVAAGLTGSGLLDVFVSNDTTPNFLFTNETARGSGLFSFRESAALAGVATDRGGYAQACMGIAIADADHNLQLDLFVTNFFNEDNTLYLQDRPGQFVDATRDANLAAPSRGLLGFGTQFLDFDLDGWEDLVIANGHVDDYRFEGVPYEMRPQLFHNEGAGRFRELRFPSDHLFSRERLGRGLARVDWNRDGRPDFVISNIHGPVTLATNVHAGPGNFLALDLRGRQSNRDAVGAKMVLRYGSTERLIAVTGGGGYAAANDRELLIGTGSAAVIDELEIEWPMGSVERYRNLPTGTRWTIVEGRGAVLRNRDSARQVPDRS